MLTIEARMVKMSYCVIITTTSTEEEALKIAESLVEMRLVACAQVLGPIASTYIWQDKREISREWLCLFKTKEELFPIIEEKIKRLHSYTVPEIVSLPITEGSKDYLAWIEDVLSAGKEGKS